jgi:hypothetical protein
MTHGDRPRDLYGSILRTFGITVPGIQILRVLTLCAVHLCPAWRFD